MRCLRHGTVIAVQQWQMCFWRLQSRRTSLATFYKSTQQLDSALEEADNPEHQGFQNYNMAGRTYRYMKEEPLYPFGHGLSYATFSYGEAQLSSHRIQAADGIKIIIPVTNSSSRDGEEVVQLYVKRNDDPEAPLKSLRAFRRVPINAGETKEVEFTVDSLAFAFYDDRTDGLLTKTGSYTLLYGGSSAERSLKSVDITIE